MGIREFLFGPPAAKASVVGLPSGELADVALEKGADDARLLSTYADDAWPYIFANKIGEQASQAYLRIGLPGSDDTFEFAPPDNPWQQLLDNPNPLQDGGEWLHLLLVYLEMVGHAPIEVVRNKGRAPSELWAHSPAPWRIVANSDRTIRGYLYDVSGEDVALTPDQMTYIRWPNPNNTWYGQGRISAARQQVMAEEYAAIRDKNFEKRLGVPPGILSSEMPLGDPQAAELQKRWEKAVGGYQNAGKIAVLGSKTTYIPVALNARDAEWLAQRMNRVETLAAAFGVPLPLVRMQDATFSNLEGARAEFWEGTLQPRLNRIARMLTRKLLPLIGAPAGYQLRFDYSEIDALGENQKEAADTAKVWAETGVVTVDEARKKLGLPAHDDPAIGARLIVPGTLSLKSVEDVTAPPAPPPDPNQPPDNMPPDTMPADMPPKRQPRKAETPFGRPTRERVLLPIQDGYRRDLSAFFVAQGGAVLGAVGKAAHEPQRTKDALPDDILERIQAIIAAQRFRERIRRISETPIRSALTLGAEDAALTLGVETTFDLAASEDAIGLLTTHLEMLGTGIQNTTLADVRGVLTEALRAGWSNEQTRSALSDLFDNYQQWRLDRISRTETTAAYNLGSVAQYREAGVALVEVVDGDGDDICAQANGSLWTLEQAQSDPLGHPNCTRTFIPEVPR